MKIALLGDSIRGGYAPLVREALRDRAEIWWPQENCGHSLAHRENLDRWYIEPEPDVIHCNSGIWDFGWDPCTAAPRILQRAYARNLKLILKALRHRSDAILIFATTTPFLRPVDAAVPRARCRVPPVVSRYNRVALKVMEEFGVAVDDLYEAVLQAGVGRCVGEDRIHMSPYGNRVLADTVVAALRRFAPGLEPAGS